MKLKWSKDGKVSFDADKHVYKLGDKQLEGVTTFIKRHANKFDAEAKALEMCGGDTVKQQELLNAWQEKGRVSREDGTACHLIIETYVNDKSILDAATPKQQAAVKFINDYLITERLTPVEAELIVYNQELATQIDLIAKNRKEQYFIFDHKSNDKISRNGYRKMMLPPFHNYPDANYYHYSLQVSLCKKLCTGYDIKDLFIVHLKPYDYEIIKAENFF